MSENKAKAQAAHLPDAETINRNKRCLAVLVHEFLEEDFGPEDLQRDPDRIERLRKLLEKNLWAGNIDPHDPIWCFESHLADAVLDEPDLYTDEELREERAEVGAKTLHNIHRILKEGFWDKFKEEVFHQQEMAALSQKHPLSYPGAKSFLPLELPSKHILPCSFEGGTIHVYKSGAHAILALVDLLQGLPIDIFRICKDKSCARCFIRVHKHGKVYCSSNCASRHNEKVKRESNRERFNRYHKEYYKISREQKDPKKRG
jgi:hypothetical protein